MADHYYGTTQLKTPRRPTTTGDGGAISWSRLRGPNSTQLMGVMALFISTGILLILTGISITTSVLGLIFFAPIVIFTSPIWVPLGALLFFVVVGVLSLCGLGLATAAAISWLYK